MLGIIIIIIISGWWFNHFHFSISYMGIIIPTDELINFFKMLKTTKHIYIYVYIYMYIYIYIYMCIS